MPRTAPDVPFFAQPAVQKSLERILYLWGIRHALKKKQSADITSSFEDRY